MNLIFFMGDLLEEKIDKYEEVLINFFMESDFMVSTDNFITSADSYFWDFFRSQGSEFAGEEDLGSQNIKPKMFNALCHASNNSKKVYEGKDGKKYKIECHYCEPFGDREFRIREVISS